MVSIVLSIIFAKIKQLGTLRSAQLQARGWVARCKAAKWVGSPLAEAKREESFRAGRRWREATKFKFDYSSRGVREALSKIKFLAIFSN